MKRVICFLTLVLALGLLVSCKTRTVLSSRVQLGMTKEEVIQKCGAPFKVSARYIDHGKTEEVLFYREKVWDNGGWSANSTIVNHLFVLVNGRLIAIEQGEEVQRVDFSNVSVGIGL